ncbi:hypothetical protein ABW21_db0207462 [Orbilia brochopaga]|nr:hypothetical protein ABW21_db0207462 [Drechslerella brochopaga]
MLMSESPFPRRPKKKLQTSNIHRDPSVHVCRSENLLSKVAAVKRQRQDSRIGCQLPTAVENASRRAISRVRRASHRRIRDGDPSISSGREIRAARSVIAAPATSPPVARKNPNSADDAFRQK